MPPLFLFITPLTPSPKINPLRAELHLCYLAALQNQTYPHWQALLIGEEHKSEGRLTYLKCEGVTKTEKLNCAFQYINSMQIKPHYLIRLDDDDLISPFVLERASKKIFDCYADKFHSFYDISNKLTAQQKRPWLANTVIHKTEHAMHPFGEKNLPLFTLDHSLYWHKFYKSRKIKWARKSHPVYLRLLSPTSISANPDNKADDEEYMEYLKSFGKWSKKMIGDFRNSRFP